MFNPALLQSWGLQGLIQREMARDQLLAKAIPLTDEQKQLAVSTYVAHLGLSTKAELQRKVLRMRYGMNGEDPMSLTGIAKTLKMSRDRTRRLEREGLEMLRNGDSQLEAYVAI